MILLLSPSKTLDLESKLPVREFTQPALLEEAKKLIRILVKYDEDDLMRLMGISKKLAALNLERFHHFTTPFTPKNARPALFTFKGDVYEGFDLTKYGAKELAFAQDHLRILSGLYGLLRPLDLMQPYRLEMGTGLHTPRGKTLYAFWGERITDQINQVIEQTGAERIINLASAEYFGAVRPERLKAPVLNVQFKEKKANGYKVIGLFAKRARGLMADYIIRNGITEAEPVRFFNLEGYRFMPNLSSETEWVFARR